MQRQFTGLWRIVEMDSWDQSFVDEEEPGFIKIAPKGRGEFHFGYIHGEIDWRVSQKGKQAYLDFSWAGYDENDAVNGRGWVSLKDGQMIGHIFFHLGEDSGFKADKA